jgi:translocation and assembly module TamB
MNGEVRARGSRLDARSPLAYRVALAATEIAGRRIDRLSLGGRAAHAVHLVHGDAHAALGDVALHGRLALVTPPIYRMVARWRLARLDALAPALPGWAAGRLRVEGQGVDPDRRVASVDVALARAAVHGVPLDRGSARGRVDGRRIELETLGLEGRDLRVAGSGALDLARRTAALELSAGADLGTVGARLGWPLGGRATLTATAGGSLDALAVNAGLTVEKPAYGSVRADGITARAELAGIGGAAGTGRLHLDAPGLRVGDARPRAARADVEWRRARDEDRARVTAAARAEEQRTQEIALTIVRTRERTRGQLETLALTAPDGSPWRLASPAGFTLDSALTIERIVLQSGPQRIALAGRLALRGASDASLTFDRLALRSLCALADGPQCGGELSGRLAVAGPADAPLMTLGAQAGGVEVASVPYGVVDLEARYASRSVRLHSTLRHPQAGSVTIDGDVPLNLAWAGPRPDLTDAPVTLTARAGDLDLTIVRALAPRTLRSAAGRLSLELHVSGPRSAPHAEGELAIDGGHVEVIGTGVPYDDIRARVSARGTHVDVTELHARAGDGTADVRGSADVAPGGASTLALAVHLDDFFAVRRQAYEAAVSGDLSVRGPLAGPEIAGTLEIERAVVRPAALPAAGPAIPRDDTIVVVNLPEAEEEPPPPETRFADPVRLAVRVVVARNAWIRRADANIELGGRIEITKEPFGPVRITGQIRLLRGWYAFQGRRFTIDQGTITFTGATPPNPTFDITAVHRTPEYRIEVRITGSADKPALALSSDPPLEQADVLSVILFGKPAHQLGRGQSVALQEQALSLAAGYVMPELRTSVMDALGLDTLDVEMPQGTTEPGRVSAGRYVAEDVFVSLGQEFGTHQAQVVGVEYSIRRNVSVRASTSTRGDSAVDLFWQYRY